MKSLDLFADSPCAVVALDWPQDYEAQFWREYPLKIAKGAAMRALNKARKNGTEWRKIVEGIRKYKIWLQGPGWRPCAAHPASWLNAGRWDDELPMALQQSKEPWQQQQDNAESYLRQMREKASNGSRGGNESVSRGQISGPAIPRSGGNDDPRAVGQNLDPRPRDLH